MRCNSIKLISRGNKTPMIGGPVRPMVVASINTPRAVWSIAEIEYYGLSGRDWNDKKKTYNNEPKNGQRDRRILGEGSVSFAN